MVEDDPHHWEIYGKTLWYNGFDVVHAADGAEGLRLARAHSPTEILRLVERLIGRPPPSGEEPRPALME